MLLGVLLLDPLAFNYNNNNKDNNLSMNTFSKYTACVGCFYSCVGIFVGLT